MSHKASEGFIQNWEKLHLLNLSQIALAIRNESKKRSQILIYLINSYQNLLGEEEYSRLEEESIMGSLISCVNCKNKFSFEPGKIQGNMKDEHGNKLTRFLSLHIASLLLIAKKKLITLKTDSNVLPAIQNNVANAKKPLIT